MVLEINENYWGKRPEIRKIIHEEIPDEQLFNWFRNRFCILLQ
jgi:hypothetical protein